MTIHEYGTDKEQVIVLVHPSVVMWDFFEYVIPLLKEDYHLIVPALPGYDEKNPDVDFTGIEEIADELAKWLIAHNINTIDLLYGCSMGGAVVLRMLAEQKIRIKNSICDGGITPYQLPWIVTRLIAVRDFLMISMGKIGGLKLLEKAFSTDEYSKEDCSTLRKCFILSATKQSGERLSRAIIMQCRGRYHKITGNCNIGMAKRKRKTGRGISSM